MMIAAGQLQLFSSRYGNCRASWDIGDAIIRDGWQQEPITLILRRGSAPMLSHGNTRAAYLGREAPELEIPVEIEIWN